MRDVIAATIACVILAPVICAIAVLVILIDGRPVTFRQQRGGRYGKPFWMYKFRTMTGDVDDNGHLLPDDQRLTWLGRKLRSASLDELPELWNVIKGDMGLVGPRPLPVAYLARYDNTEMRRHDVRPGLTGWAQVNGRNLTSWEERLAMDVWYVDHRSPLLDVRIMARTISVVLRREGVNPKDGRPMKEFRPIPPHLTHCDEV